MKKIFSILLVAALVITGTIGATGMSVSAAEEDLNPSSNTITSSSQNKWEQAENYRLEAVKLAREGINKVASKSQRLRLDTVSLGTDRTFSDAGWGVYWSDEWGIVNGDCYSQSFLETNQAEANNVYYGGSGGACSIAWVGNQFSVSGSGSQSANIYIVGSFLGNMRIISGSASLATEITLVVKDDTTGTTYHTEILDVGLSRQGYDCWGDTFNNGLNILLQAGHQYSAYLCLEVSSGLTGVGDFHNDWGRFDWDSGEYANFSYIKVDF